MELPAYHGELEDGPGSGPVVAVITLDDEEDAVRQANDTIYGLSGSIWTRNGARALSVARRIETGVISANLVP